MYIAQPWILSHLSFLLSFLQQLFEFIKIIKAHNGPIEDLAFNRYSLRLASSGSGYPQVWGLGQFIYELSVSTYLHARCRLTLRTRIYVFLH